MLQSYTYTLYNKLGRESFIPRLKPKVKGPGFEICSLEVHGLGFKAFKFQDPIFRCRHS